MTKYLVTTALMLGLTTAAAATLGGCKTVPPPIEGRADSYGHRQIMMDSRELQNRTSVGLPHAARDEAGLLFVTVPITNTTRKPLDVEYRVTFFDPGGVPTSPPTTWFRKRLTPRVSDFVRVNSTTPRAADFQVDFRRAR